MNVIVVKNEQELAQKAFEKINEVIEKNNEAVLGMATGGSPLGIYELMRKNKPHTSGITTINLDEYVGVPHEHETSYHYYMNDVLFNHLPFKQTYVPDGMAADLQEACKAYDAIIEENPVDLQLLGIGENGHIGFNEPGTPFTTTTHIVALTESTRQANRRYFEKAEDVPTKAITMGIASIMKAKEILLIAAGEKKADAIFELLSGTVSESCPATVLQNHPNVTIIVDEAAVAKYKASK
ncbi:MAG: glucosamine-6-phosphate deaminase [Bacillaceae bacterium]